jgi:uncharacterized membrane protein YcaP (DUF421 family)
MWTNLSALSLSPFNFIIRAVVVYLFVLLLVRVSGKRQIGQMSAIEFVTILLISNAVQNSMNGGDNSLIGGLMTAATLILLTNIIAHLSYRSKKAQHLFEGVPTLLVHKGAVIETNMKKELISHSELVTLLRKQGIHHLAELRSAVLESDGSLSVTRISDPG